MLEIVPFEPSHAIELSLQPAQSHISLSEEYAKGLFDTTKALGGVAFSGIDTDTGNVVGCAGIFVFWEGRAQVWALLSKQTGRHFTAIHRAVLSEIAKCKAHRIEAVVDSRFENGKRWVEMLGFSFEGTMRAYTTQGNDCDLYAIVRK